MSNVVAQCTHIKTNGEVCGSPAVSGTDLCYHHSAVKTTLAKARPSGKAPDEGFAPIPFLFPEDRASMQINFFLLLQAFNEQRIDHRTYRLMLSMLKAMAKNLGKTGSLVDEPSDQRSAGSDQKDRVQGSGATAQETRDQRSAASDKTVSVQASAEVFSGPIAPESCFSTNPKAYARKGGVDSFPIRSLDLAGHGPRQGATS